MVNSKARGAAVAAIAIVTLGVGWWFVAGSPKSPPVVSIVSDATPAPAKAPALPSARRGKGEHALDGRVEDGTQSPMSGVAISAQREPPPGPPADAAVGYDTEPEVVAIAGADGSFRLEGLMAGRYRLKVEGDSAFASEVRFVEVPGAELTIVVARRAKIEGRVWLGGKPVPAAQVMVLDERTGILSSTTTTEDGRFSVGDLVEGRYRIAATKGAEVAPTILVDRGGPGPFEPVRLSLVAGHMVSGRVVDDAGAGVAALVTLVSVAGEVPRRVRSGVDGRFGVGGVLLGAWTARAEAGGYITAEEVGFAVGSGYEPLLRLSHGGRVTGFVRDANGSGVQGAVISVVGVDLAGSRRSYGSDSAVGVPSGQLPFGPSSDARFVPTGELGVLLGPIPLPPPPGARSVLVASPVASEDAGQEQLRQDVKTGSDGGFEVSGLAPGRYRVIARHPGYADARSPEFGASVGKTHEVALTMRTGAFVVGVVTAAGSPISGAVIRAFSSADSQGATDEVARAVAVTGTDGRYRIGPFVGAIRMRAEATGYGSAEQRVNLGPNPAREVERAIELVAAREKIAGRVIDGAGFPVAGARVQLVSGLGRLDLTDEHGRFALEGLVAGSHSVSVERDGYPRLQTSLTTRSSATLTLEYGGGVEVLAIDRHTDRSVSAAQVGLEGPAPVGSKSTDERGTAVFMALVPGRYRVAVAHPDYVSSTRVVDVARAERIGGVSVRDFRVLLERGATVAGTVRDRNGLRIGGALVRVGDVRARSDVNGRFRLERVPSGAVDVEAEASAGKGSASVSLDPGDEVVTLEIVLE